MRTNRYSDLSVGNALLHSSHMLSFDVSLFTKSSIELPDDAECDPSTSSGQAATSLFNQGENFEPSPANLDKLWQRTIDSATTAGYQKRKDYP